MSVQGGLWCSYDFLSAFLSVTKRQMSVAVLNLRIYFSFEDLNCFEYLIYFFLVWQRWKFTEEHVRQTPTWGGDRVPKLTKCLTALELGTSVFGLSCYLLLVN